MQSGARPHERSLATTRVGSKAIRQVVRRREIAISTALCSIQAIVPPRNLTTRNRTTKPSGYLHSFPKPNDTAFRTLPGCTSMKVLFFANTDWYLYNFRLPLAKAIRELGVEVVLVSPPGPYGQRLSDQGFRWIPIAMQRRSLKPLREARLIKSLI